MKFVEHRIFVPEGIIFELDALPVPSTHTESSHPTDRDGRLPNRLLKKAFSCSDRLSTNGKSPTTSSLPPFALSLSKGERRVFQHPVKGLRERKWEGAAKDH